HSVPTRRSPDLLRHQRYRTPGTGSASGTVLSATATAYETRDTEPPDGTAYLRVPARARPFRERSQLPGEKEKAESLSSEPILTAAGNAPQPPFPRQQRQGRVVDSCAHVPAEERGQRDANGLRIVDERPVAETLQDMDFRFGEDVSLQSRKPNGDIGVPVPPDHTDRQIVLGDTGVHFREGTDRVAGVAVELQHRSLVRAVRVPIDPVDIGVRQRYGIVAVEGDMHGTLVAHQLEKLAQYRCL